MPQYRIFPILNFYFLIHFSYTYLKDNELGRKQIPFTNGKF